MVPRGISTIGACVENLATPVEGMTHMIAGLC